MDIEKRIKEMQNKLWHSTRRFEKGIRKLSVKIACWESVIEKIQKELVDCKKRKRLYDDFNKMGEEMKKRKSDIETFAKKIVDEAQVKLKCDNKGICYHRDYIISEDAFLRILKEITGNE